MLVTDVGDSNLKTVYVGDKFGMLMTDFNIKKSPTHRCHQYNWFDILFQVFVFQNVMKLAYENLAICNVSSHYGQGYENSI